MDQKWTKNGPEMDQKWTKMGYKMKQRVRNPAFIKNSQEQNKTRQDTRN